MPVQPPGVWGIDLGQCGLKAIRLQEIDGQVVATAFDYVEHPKILSQPDADPDQLTREALDKFLSRNTLRGDVVAISVPGQSGLARFVKLPPVEEKKIADIVRFEAKQQIPFNLEEVVWDYQKIGSGAVTDGFAMETEIGLFAMKRDMVNRYLQHFKDVGVDIHLVQMAPLALCNYVAFDLLVKESGAEEGGEKKCIVALDIGADSSNLVITDGERIIWQRPIPLGGNHFTRALTKDLKLTFAKAEHLKRNATKSPDLKKILAALRPVLNDFVGEVQRSLGYFTNTHRDAHIEYMVGLGNAFRLPGLQKFLAEKLQLEVRKLGKMERVSGDQVVAQQAYTENVLTFAVAYGLALQGLKRARLLTNLLPNEIRVDRLVKAKKPFAVAAAAALLLACGGLALSYALEYRTYNDQRVLDAIKASEDASTKAKTAKAAFEAAKKKAREEEAAVQTIVAGQFERDNWPELYKFIHTAVPQPDGREHTFPILDEDGNEIKKLTLPNIPKDAVPKYWMTPGSDKPTLGLQAYREYLERVGKAGGGKEGGDGNESSAGSEDLIQFNIESVNTFYCDSLPAYWDQVKAIKRIQSNGKGLVRPQEQFNVKPEGSGWIVEIHGWTNHRDKDSFVRNTLLENLARLGIQTKKADAAPGGVVAPGSIPSPAGIPPRAPAGAPGLPGQGVGGPVETAENLGPVINHISHVILFNWAESASDASSFKILNAETHKEVRDLALSQPVVAEKEGAGAGGAQGMGGGAIKMPGAGAGAPAGGMGGMAGGGGAQGGEKAAPVGPDRANWTPLGEPEAAAGGAGGMGNGPVRGGPKAPPGMQPGGKMQPRLPGGAAGKPIGQPAGATEPATPVAEGGLQRTEFVILFVWKEPTPSDSLRGLSTTPASPVPGAPPSAAPAAGPAQPITHPRPRRAKKEEKKDDPKAEKKDDRKGK
jgi:type IV pilus assembly protein PilM